MTGQHERTTADEIQVERYRYILRRLHAVNENVHRFLAIFQTLATVLAGAMLALVVGHRGWGIAPDTARAGVLGFMGLITLVALFTVLIVAVGVLAWMDYRREECELTDDVVGPGFRKPPRWRHLLRWYETYVVLFVVASVTGMWLLVMTVVLPSVD